MPYQSPDRPNRGLRTLFGWGGLLREVAAEKSSETGEDPCAAPRHSPPGKKYLDEEEARNLRIQSQMAREGANGTTDPQRPRRARPIGGSDLSGGHCGGHLDRGGKAIGDTIEVRIEPAPGESGDRENVGNGEIFVAALGNDPRGGFDQYRTV